MLHRATLRALSNIVSQASQQALSCILVFSPFVGVMPIRRSLFDFFLRRESLRVLKMLFSLQSRLDLLAFLSSVVL